MNITSLPSASANTVSHHNVVDRAPVGLESRDDPNTTLKPVERAADSAGTQASRKETEERSYLLEGKESSVADEQKRDNEIQSKAQDIAQQRQVEQERMRIKELASRDREVRAHEQAHAAVGGQHAGAPKYQYERGPDGVNYAIGGEVPISVSKGATPADTIAKAATIRAAALAPAEPSSQDRSVAAQATQLEAEARREMRIEQIEEGRAAEAKREIAANESNDRSSVADDKSSSPEQAKEEQSRPTGLSGSSYINSQDSGANRPGSLLDSTV